MSPLLNYKRWVGDFRSHDLKSLEILIIGPLNAFILSNFACYNILHAKTPKIKRSEHAHARWRIWKKSIFQGKNFKLVSCFPKYDCNRQTDKQTNCCIRHWMDPTNSASRDLRLVTNFNKNLWAQGFVRFKKKFWERKREREW